MDTREFASWVLMQKALMESRKINAGEDNPADEAYFEGARDVLSGVLEYLMEEEEV